MKSFDDFKHRSKPFLKAFYFTFGVFLFLFVIGRIGEVSYVSILASQTKNDFQSGISRDLSYIKDIGDTAASDPAVIQDLAKNNAQSLLQIINQKASQYGMAFSVTDKNGVVVGRTQKLGIQGDNLFLTLPEGRVVSKGTPVSSVGLSIIDPHILREVSARPVLSDGKMIGAIFTGYQIDNTYAARFKQTYFSDGIQVAFYTKGFGIYSDTFDPSFNTILDSYFNSGSEWIQNGLSEQTVTFDGKNYYLVENIALLSLNGQSYGGALIFIPRYGISNVANIASAIIFSYFLFFQHYICMHALSEKNEIGTIIFF